MKKVITYGTYDLLHYGHIRLLERAKALGDYLIVGVTSDDFDKARGKINVTQSLIARMQAVRDTGIADEVIVEEYEGQKIDDIRRYGVDIFTVGSDWTGKFDYLKEYCEVVYLDRTEGVSSTTARSENSLKLGLYGDSVNVDKIAAESAFVDGLEIAGKATTEEEYEALLCESDAVYIYSHPEKHEEDIRKALEKGKHVLCETPIALSKAAVTELFNLASKKHAVLMEALKTAYSTAYTRLMLLLKSGKIGEIVSVDAACTSIENIDGLSKEALSSRWSSIYDWGPTGLLPVFDLFGTDYRKKGIVLKMAKENDDYDIFAKIGFIFDQGTAGVKVGKGVKSEGELVISGTKGYAYVPAPWWKTEYFEIRYEDTAKNTRYFYQLEGEGIRYELVNFLQAVRGKTPGTGVQRAVTEGIASVMEARKNGEDVTVLKG